MKDNKEYAELQEAFNIALVENNRLRAKLDKLKTQVLDKINEKYKKWNYNLEYWVIDMINDLEKEIKEIFE